MFSGEQELGNQNQANADDGGKQGPEQEFQEIAKLKGFEQEQPGIVDEAEYAYIKQVGYEAAQTFQGWFLVVGIGAFLGDEDADEERPQVGDEYTGGRMKPGMVAEGIQCGTKQEGQQQLKWFAEPEWHPQNEQEIDVGYDGIMQMHFIQHKVLHQNQYYKSKYVFNRCAQGMKVWC